MASIYILKVSFSYTESFSPIDSVDEHYDEILLFWTGGLWKHCLQTGLYDSAPPTSSTSSD